MSSPAAQTRAASDEELPRLLALIEDSDSVELKLTIPDGEQRSAMAALGLDPLDAQIRQVFFFDTPDLQLNACGLVVRARRVQKRGDDSVVKLRPVVPSELRDRLAPRPVVQRRGRRDAGRVRLLGHDEGGAGDRQPGPRGAGRQAPDAQALQQGAARLAAAYAPDGLDDRRSAASWGRSSCSSSSWCRRRCAAGWSPRCGSTRTTRRSSSSRPGACPTRRSTSPRRLRGFLVERGLDVGGEQQTKTRTALQMLS